MNESKKREIARRHIQEAREYVEFVDVHDILVDEHEVDEEVAEGIARDILDLIYRAKVEVTW